MFAMQLLLVIALFAAALPTYAFECSTSTFAAILPTNATISYAVSVPANGTFAHPSPEFPANDTGLPALCAISVNVLSSPTSSFNFGLFLPQTWNARFLATGNGGFGGGINWNDMETGALAGFAAMSTDTGHLSGTDDASWALNNTEAQIDWGYRAMHGSVALAKNITAQYYGSEVKYSYYSGCSTGSFYLCCKMLSSGSEGCLGSQDNSCAAPKTFPNSRVLLKSRGHSVN